MALTFTTDISETVLLDSYVNNVVEFESDNVSQAFKCTINIDGSLFEITPNNNTFYFNFKSVFKSLINDYFEDSINVELDSNDLTTFIKNMSQVTKEVTIDFIVDFINGTTESVSRSVTLLQSTSNFQDRKKREILKLDSFALLSNLEPSSNRTFRAVYFEGYPFDIQVYKNTPGNVVLTNKTNLLDVTFNLPNKVNRIFFSDAETDTTIEDVLPLVEGTNQLEFDTGDLTTVLLEKRSGLCGVYLKWKNQFGGWSYWLFERKHQVERKTKNLGFINNDYQNLDNNNFIKNIGKTSYDTYNIGSVNVDVHDQELVMSILESPKVYLYLGVNFAKDEETDWLSVNLDTDSAIVKNYKDRPMDISFDIELPERNNLVL